MLRRFYLKLAMKQFWFPRFRLDGIDTLIYRISTLVFQIPISFRCSLFPAFLSFIFPKKRQSGSAKLSSGRNSSPLATLPKRRPDSPAGRRFSIISQGSSAFVLALADHSDGSCVRSAQLLIRTPLQCSRCSDLPYGKGSTTDDLHPLPPPAPVPGL